MSTCPSQNGEAVLIGAQNARMVCQSVPRNKQPRVISAGEALPGGVTLSPWEIYEAGVRCATAWPYGVLEVNREIGDSHRNRKDR